MPATERADAPVSLLHELRTLAAIPAAIANIDLDRCRSSRLVRSAVERACILIGEAVAAMRRHSPVALDRIREGARIVDVRNQLTHQYVHVN